MTVTKVIFRSISEQVIALFPEIPAAHSSIECLYYYCGQYGTCNFQSTLQRSTACKADEYADTYEQLVHLRYTLAVINWTEEISTSLNNERHHRYDQVYSSVYAC